MHPAMTALAMLVRGVRRRLLCGRDVNPCTLLLVILFFSSVTFLISAIRSHVGRHQPSAIVSAKDNSIDVGGHFKNMQQRRLQSKDTIRWKSGNDYVLVGDDEIQVCQMSRSWAVEAEDSGEMTLPSETPSG
jgi:hypothetical protein